MATRANVLAIVSAVYANAYVVALVHVDVAYVMSGRAVGTARSRVGMVYASL